MVNVNAILKYLQEKTNNVSISKIETLINEMNRDEIEKSQKERFKYVIWDKKTPINNIDANTIISSRNYDIGQAYLIYIDDKLVYFQDHNPEKEGYVKMTKNNVEKIASNFINKKIEENTDNIITNRVIEQILSK